MQAQVYSVSEDGWTDLTVMLESWICAKNDGGWNGVSKRVSSRTSLGNWIQISAMLRWNARMRLAASLMPLSQPPTFIYFSPLAGHWLDWMQGLRGCGSWQGRQKWGAPRPGPFHLLPCRLPHQVTQLILPSPGRLMNSIRYKRKRRRKGK